MSSDRNIIEESFFSFDFKVSGSKISKCDSKRDDVTKRNVDMM